MLLGQVSDLLVVNTCCLLGLGRSPWKAEATEAFRHRARGFVETYTRLEMPDG